MKKKKKYTPKPWAATDSNPVGLVLTRFTPMRSEPEELNRLKTINHNALNAVRTGEGTKHHADTLIAAVNMSEALMLTAGHGTAYAQAIRVGQDAVHSLCSRAKRSTPLTFTFTGLELTATTESLEILDAQLAISTVGELGTAIKYILKVQRSSTIRRIK